MKINKSFRIFKAVLLILFLATASSLFIEDVYADECDEVLELVNEERAKDSLPPLRMDEDLKKAAKIRSEEVTIVFGHTRPDGSKFFTVSPKVKSENLAAGQKTPKEVVSAWMKSPGHRKNILNPKYTTIGINYKKTDTGYKNYWVQVFGSEKPKKIQVVSEKPKEIQVEKISGIKVERRQNQISLKWDKQVSSKVSGYEIFVYSSKNKKFQLLGKITNPNISSLILTGLKSSTTYKYQIKSYKVIDRKVYYSTPSKISVRTKN